VASVVTSSEWLTFKGAAGERPFAAVDVTCVVIDGNGKQLQSYSTRVDLSMRPGAADIPRRNVVRDFQFKSLKPGLYQVRAAARDAGSGRIGGVARWIEIPDLSKGQLSLGGVVISELNGAPADGDPSKMFATVKSSAGRPLSRGSRLQFSTDVYNARRTGGQLLPSVTVRAVIVANGHLLADTGEHEVMTDGPVDFSRLPFSGEINLEALPPGLYSLQVTATDRADGKSVTQLAKFSIR
jgi:hypothetical protein